MSINRSPRIAALLNEAQANRSALWADIQALRRRTRPARIGKDVAEALSGKVSESVQSMSGALSTEAGSTAVAVTMAAVSYFLGRGSRAASPATSSNTLGAAPWDSAQAKTKFQPEPLRHLWPGIIGTAGGLIGYNLGTYLPETDLEREALQKLDITDDVRGFAREHMSGFKTFLADSSGLPEYAAIMLGLVSAAAEVAASESSSEANPPKLQG